MLRKLLLAFCVLTLNGLLFYNWDLLQSADLGKGVEKTSNISYCRRHPPVLFILILSHVRNVAQRDVLRRAWLHNAQPHLHQRHRPTSVTYMFLVGKDNKFDNGVVHMEHSHHKDILQSDIMDDYMALTNKTLSGFKWVVRHVRAAYIFKTDDDVFLNLRTMQKLILLQSSKLKHKIFGKCFKPSVPRRDPLSKWFVSTRQYPKPLFPSYCSGTGYGMKLKTLRKLLAAAADIGFLYLEDVYFGAAAQAADISVQDIPGFNSHFIELNTCADAQQIITSHEVPPQMNLYISRNCDVSYRSFDNDTHM